MFWGSAAAHNCPRTPLAKPKPPLQGQGILMDQAAKRRPTLREADGAGRQTSTPSSNLQLSSQSKFGAKGSGRLTNRSSMPVPKLPPGPVLQWQHLHIDNRKPCRSSGHSRKGYKKKCALCSAIPCRETRRTGGRGGGPSPRCSGAGLGRRTTPRPGQPFGRDLTKGKGT